MDDHDVDVSRVRSGWMQRLARPPLNVDSAAARAQAYIFGNLAVLATLAAIGPTAAGTVRGVLLVAGAAVSAFAAHIIAEAYARRVRTSDRPTLGTMARSIRDSVPILTSALVPVALLTASVTLDVPALVTYLLAMLYVVARFLFLGVIVGRLRGVRSSWRTTTAGVALAMLGVVLAAFEFAISR